MTKIPSAEDIPSKAFIASKNVTASAIAAEAAALGPDFPKVTFPVVDMLAEAREMLLARGDVPDFLARDYHVTDEMFERIEVLANLLGPSAVRAQAPRLRQAHTQAARAARGALLAIREQLARIGDAAGFAPSEFAVDTQTFNRLVDTMAHVIGTVERIRSRLPDKPKVDALVAEATRLIDLELQARLDAATMVKQRKNNTLKVGQLKWLLYDQMRHISKQGFSAYPHDAERELWYRLERFLVGKKGPKG